MNDVLAGVGLTHGVAASGRDRPCRAGSCFEALASRTTRSIVILDDIQWAEPTFLDLVEHITDRSREVPMLIACLARPELLNPSPDLGRRQAERQLHPARAADARRCV